MTFQVSASHFRNAQSGAVMVVSMLLLLVMTVLALGASQATRMQERMAGNARDQDLALQTAEAGLRAGERLVDDPTLTEAPWPCASGRCRVYELGVLNVDVAFQNESWWDANAWGYRAATTWNAAVTNEIAAPALNMSRRDPQFFVEEIEEVRDALSIPPTGPAPSRMYYRITATGPGGSQTAQAVLQSTFARRFN